MKWKKPNGNEIETNDSKVTQDYMKSMGCKVIDGPATPQGDPTETVEISEADIPENLPMSDPEPDKAA